MTSRATLTILRFSFQQLNNTLANNCPKAGSSDNQTNIWSSVYGPPIAYRLNTQALGANVTAKDISNFISLCALETVAKDTLIQFCALFTPDEFAQFEYWADLGKYYVWNRVLFFFLSYCFFPLNYVVQIRTGSWSSSRCRLH